MEKMYWVRVALDIPLFALYDYMFTQPVPVGTRVIVPFGKRKLVGMVIDQPEQPSIDAAQVKQIDQVLDDIPPMPSSWLRMAKFAAQYYKRPIGEVVLPALPASLRKVSAYQGKRSAGGPVHRIDKRKKKQHESPQTIPSPKLTTKQQEAATQIKNANKHIAFLLYGVTGSGKTEVYIQAIEAVIKKGLQVLLLVPEINLTPQLEQSLVGRLAVIAPDATIAVMHSGLSEGERLRSWLQAQRGEASILLGTRLAIFAHMPNLGLIVVDEEHDPSYKQQDGLRYSARDLAVWRAHDLNIPIVLGSATPSLESWNHVQTGRYQCLNLPDRAKEVALPEITLVDTRRLQMEQGFSPQLLSAIQDRLQEQQQVLIFLNRRGYAPVLNCSSCGWVTQCKRCTAYMVLHRARSRTNYLQCHHCGCRARVPASCPDCGDQDLKPMGRGTQRVEEFLGEQFPSARIIRIDADSTRGKGKAAQLLNLMHEGEADILIGTQMVAKGHDFAKLGLVGVLNADAMLFAQDFRAPERLFAQLTQVSGRAGRHTKGGQVIIQTDYPDQTVYQALRQHNYTGFANHILDERKAVGLPPFVWQALLMAESKELAHAINFLQQAGAMPAQKPQNYPMAQSINIFDPVPLRVVRVANIERAQLLIDCSNRIALQNFLSAWANDLPNLARQLKVRYTLEVDPQYI